MVTRLARIAVRHPRLVIAVWGACVVALAIPATTVQSKLVPATLFVPGTESYDWKQLREPSYGTLIAVILEGPAQEIDRQGPVLARALALRTDTLALSAWSPGGGDGAKLLRPQPNRAVIALDVTIPEGGNDSTIVPPLEHFIEERLKPPLKAHLTGDPPLGRELNEAGFHAMEQGERIAAPILIFVLLLVFRSVIAAAIPLVIAGGTVAMGFGTIRIFTEFTDLAIMAMSLASMIGLALGVDYALLIVSRFREALAQGLEPKQAATLAANTAGRTAIFAATVLSGLMLAVMLLSPGPLLLSASIGAIIVTIYGAIGGLMVCPAVLTLLGHRVNKWQIGGKRKKEGHGLIHRIMGVVGSRPAATAGIVLATLLAFASPVLALKTSPPDPKQLPLGNEGREAFEALRRAEFGPNVDIALRETGGGAITSPKRLRQLATFQERLRKLDLIKFVAGPGDLADRTAALRNAPTAIKKAKRQLAGAERELNQRTRQVDDAKGQLAGERQFLEEGLGDARGMLDNAERLLGSAGGLGDFTTLVTGLAAARDGTRQLRDGAGLLQHKAAILADALRQARDAVAKLVPQVEQADKQLHTAQAAIGALRVPVQVTERELANALAALGRVTAGNADPAVQETRVHVSAAYAAATGRNPLNGQLLTSSYQGIDHALTQAVAAAKAAGDQADEAVRQAQIGEDVTIRLASGSARLVDPGLATLHRGLRDLASGLALAHDRVAAARPRIEGLQKTAAQGIADGKRMLAEAEAHAFPRLSAAEDQLSEASTRIHTVRDQLVDRAGPFAPLRSLDALERDSPFFFQSPYVVVAGLQGAPTYERRTAVNIVDSRSGGDVGHIALLPDIETNAPEQKDVVDAVRREADRFQAQTGMRTEVGGSAAELEDFKSAMIGRFPLIVLALCAITYLMLVPILRTIVLPAIAIGLNLLTVSVSFAVLALGFVDGVVSDPAPLGGSGAPDIVAITAVFCVVFALSIDYYVFLLTRMREEYVRTQSNEEAVRFGIEKTATVVTGAAVIMLGVFSAFALANFAIVRQLGVGLTVAIAIDATLVRLALLPALMRLFGDATWFMPDWLEQRLPEIDIEGAAFEHEFEGMVVPTKA
jgi:RND superfamily putative drug exporter